MYETNVAAVERYLAQLQTGGDFADIPMREDIRFVGPLNSATSAANYRSISQDLAEAVREIAVSALVGNDQVIHAV